MHSAIWQSSSTSTNPKCMLNGARVPVNHSSINSTMRIFMLDDSQFYWQTTFIECFRYLGNVYIIKDLSDYCSLPKKIFFLEI